jgi:hypothetical protein
VPASKRRRAAASRRLPVVVEAPVARAPEPAPAPVPRRWFRPVQLSGAGRLAGPARPRGPAKPDPLSQPSWTTPGFLVLLGMAFLVQIPIGVVIHVTASIPNLLIVDIFLFQPQYLVVACVLFMPIARRLTGQSRNLRLLESLSLGIMYALLSLIMALAFVHPANGSVSNAQFIKQLKVTDGLLIAAGDLLAVAGTSALYPGFSRLLGTPGRRARARALERNASGSRRPPGGTKPKR